jgi:microcystin-dependent protein
MPSTPSTRLRFEKQATGENLNTWGTRLNASGIDLFEAAIAGVVTKSLTGNVTLTVVNFAADEARAACLVFTDGGLGAMPTVTIPAVQKLYLVHNKGTTYDITITAGNAAAIVGAGLLQYVYCDGTDVFVGTDALDARNAADDADAAKTAAEAAAVLTAADRVQTGLDRVQTGLDVIATNADRIAVEAALTTASIVIASEAEAQAGTDNAKLMTPLRTAQAITAQGSIPVGGIIMWSGSIASIPSNYALCDGTNSTPDLRDRFIVGAGSTYAVDATGGAASVTLSAAQIPAHTHSFSATTGSGGSHTHTASTGSAGSHSHTGGTSTAGDHTHTAAGAGSGVLASTVNGDTPFAIAGNTGTAGAHSHSLSINAAGDHAHAVTVNAGGAHTHSVSGTTGPAGSGASHENLPPYLALAFIMRTS